MKNTETHIIVTDSKPVIDILNILFKDIHDEKTHEKRFQYIQQLECFTRSIERLNLLEVR